MGILLDIHGTSFEVFPNEGRMFSVQEIEFYVGGGYDFLHLPQNMVMFWGTTNHLKFKPVNLIASVLSQFYGKGKVPFFIHGPILLVEMRETGDLTTELEAIVLPESTWLLQ